jgi:hypothetical protein
MTDDDKRPLTLAEFHRHCREILPAEPPPINAAVDRVAVLQRELLKAGFNESPESQRLIDAHKVAGEELMAAAAAAGTLNMESP